MSGPELLLAVSGLLAAAVGLVYLYQLVYLVVPFFAPQQKHGVPKPNRYAILIPARNEQLVLPYLLDSIRAQNYPQELISVYVIADNCTDNTAGVAEKHGAEVVVRHNANQVGKGYALNYLLRYIEREGRLPLHDIFMVFDADNLLEPDYISRINQCFSDGYEAACGCRLSKNPADSWISAGYALWYIHDSVHLNASRQALGVSCAVSGTGFGFTSGLYRRMGGWSFFTLTEDIEFNAWCAVNGVCIGYCPSAVLYDEQPVSFPQSWKQRIRWVQGGIQVSLKYGSQLLRGMRSGGRRAWGCFETLTLSVWGYLTCAVSSLISLCTALVFEETAAWLAAAGVNMYTVMLLIGLLSLGSKWPRIHASAGRKLLHCLAFPIFMASYIPVGICAFFSKFRWQPVHHSVAVPIEQMHR